MAAPTNPHDHFFKDLMTRPGVAAIFLANYLPPEVVATLDVSRPELIKDSFVDEQLREHRSDLLFRVKRLDGAAAYVYILFEHKSAPDEMVAWQLLRYIVKIWEMLQRQGGKRLPPIFPLVFYHGAARWPVAREFSRLVELNADDPLRAYVPEFRYHLCDLSAYDEQRIKDATLLYIGLRVLRAIRQRDFLPVLAEAVRTLWQLQDAGAMAYLQTVLRYAVMARQDLTRETLREIIVKNVPETEVAMAISLAAKSWLREGKREGMRQARLKVKKQLATRAERLVIRRFGALDETAQAQLHALSFDQLGDLIEAMFDFNAAADLTAWLRERVPPPDSANSTSLPSGNNE